MKWRVLARGRFARAILAMRGGGIDDGFRHFGYFCWRHTKNCWRLAPGMAKILLLTSRRRRCQRIAAFISLLL